MIWQPGFRGGVMTNRLVHDCARLTTACTCSAHCSQPESDHLATASKAASAGRAEALCPSSAARRATVARAVARGRNSRTMLATSATHHGDPEQSTLTPGFEAKRRGRPLRSTSSSRREIMGPVKSIRVHRRFMRGKIAAGETAARGGARRRSAKEQMSASTGDVASDLGRDPSCCEGVRAAHRTSPGARGGRTRPRTQARGRHRRT